MAGIYIHIPFCRQACHYCNFHFSTSLHRTDDMVLAIINEIKTRKRHQMPQEIGSIYLGGGTPSLLTIPQLQSLIHTVTEHHQLSLDIEITLEANPEDITSDYLDAIQSLGINRLSVGIQSFEKEDLSTLNRAHTIDQSHKALELINGAQLRSYTIDLMFGLIGRSLADWEDNLQTALSYKPPHISCYNLTIEEQTAYAKWKSTGKIQESSDTLQHAQYELSHTILTSAGYDHYEISNYALEGHHAVHNTNYWRSIPYVGYGPGAHSYIDPIRSWNVANNALYIKNIHDPATYRSQEVLIESDRYNELIMLGLRTKWGINKTKLNQFSSQIKYHWDSVSRQLIQENILIENKTHFVLHPAWWYVSDDIAVTLFVAVDA